MDVLVVARRAAARWAATATLGLPARAACTPAEAASRLTHPSSPRPDAVLLLVEDEADVVWLRRQTARRRRGAVPVVATAPARLVAGAGAAGAHRVLDADTAAELVREALAEVTAPAVVIDLDTVRTA